MKTGMDFLFVIVRIQERPPRRTDILVSEPRIQPLGVLGARGHRRSVSRRPSGLGPCHAVSPCPGVFPRAVTVPLPTVHLQSRLPEQRGANLSGVLRARARTALAPAQLKPGVEAAARGERHAQAKRLARSADRLHTDVGRPPHTALQPVKPVPQLDLVALRRVELCVSHPI